MLSVKFVNRDGNGILGTTTNSPASDLKAILNLLQLFHSSKPNVGGQRRRYDVRCVDLSYI